MIKILKRICLYSLLLTIAILVFPISTTKSRAVLLFSFFLTICSGFFLLKGKWKIAYSATILFLFLIVALPGRRIDTENLKESYINSLLKYEGTKYLWGGENVLGIDCSGLVRRALVNANLTEGTLSLNPTIIRNGITLWWYDRTAISIKKEYRGETHNLFKSNSINEIDHTKIRRGDMAVTSDGIHVLAYIGNKLWIEADPNLQKVIIVKVPEPKNIWFNTPVNVVRWKLLESTFK